MTQDQKQEPDNFIPQGINGFYKARDYIGENFRAIPFAALSLNSLKDCLLYRSLPRADRQSGQPRYPEFRKIDAILKVARPEADIGRQIA